MTAPVHRRPPKPVSPPPLPVLSINSVTALEGNSGFTPFVFTVTLSAASSQLVSVNYATQDVSALAGSDYVATSGVLTFQSGETSKTIIVNVIGDTVVEPDESFRLVLSTPINATLGANIGTGTILNDDTAAGLPSWMSGLQLGQWFCFDGQSGRPNSSLKANFPNNGVGALSPDWSKISGAFDDPTYGQPINSSIWGPISTGIRAESGACRFGTAFLIHGGGGAHRWFGNEVRKYDIGLDNPLWNVIGTPTKQSLVVTSFNQTPGVTQYPWPGDTWPDRHQYYPLTVSGSPGTDTGQIGGKPISMHSYNRVQCIEQTGSYANHLVLPGFTMGWYDDGENYPATAPDGSFYTLRFCGMDMSTEAWHPDAAEISPGVKWFPDLPINGHPGNQIVKYPIVGTAFDECIYLGGYTRLYVFDPRHPELSWQMLCNNALFNPNDYGCSAIDTTAKRFVYLRTGGASAPFNGWYFDFGASPNATVIATTFTLTGPGASLPSAGGLRFNQALGSPSASARPAICYDAGLDCFIIYQGDQRLWTMKKNAGLNSFDVQLMGTVQSANGTPTGTVAIGPPVKMINGPSDATHDPMAPPYDEHLGGSEGGHGMMQYFPALGGIGMLTSAVTDSQDAVAYFLPTTVVAPPPTTGLYPQSFTQVSDVEFPFSDMPNDPGGNFFSGASWKQTLTVNDATLQTQPGYYDAGSSSYWANQGGDWWGRGTASPTAPAPDLQGTIPWASTVVVDTNTARYIPWDVTDLVKAWIGRAPRNAGLMMKGTGAGDTIHWNTSWATSNVPQLDITTASGTVTLNASRSLELASSTTVTQGGGADMRTQANGNARGLVWFDLTAYSDPSAIISATYRCYTTSQFSNQTVEIYAVRNQNDPDLNPNPIVSGLAAGYTNDIGIENHPDVVFYEDFRDEGFRTRIYLGADRPGAQCRTVTADEPAAGFTRLLGQFNAVNIYFVAGGFPGIVDAVWPTYNPPALPADPNLLRLPGKDYSQPPDELYFRYYIFLPEIGSAPWHPSPQGGKMPGFDGRFGNYHVTPYPGIYSMGRGNSGSCCDGITGYSARGGYNRYPIVGSPTENLYWLGAGGDVYDLYLSGPGGTDYGQGLYVHDQKYATALRRGMWHCIEQRLKLNTVTQPTQKPREVLSLTQSGGVATCVLKNAETDPLYATGQVWATGGAARSGGGGDYNFPHTITVVNSTTFTFAVNPATAATAVAYGDSNTPTGTARLWATPSIGNKDGIVASWVNGRLATYANFAWFRHSKWTTDGALNFGIYALWFSVYHGGQASPDQDASFYLSKIVAAKSYIGPMNTG